MLNNVNDNNVLTSPQGDANRHEIKDVDKEKKETNPIQNNLMEYQNCHHHKDISKNLDAPVFKVCNGFDGSLCFKFCRLVA